MVHEVTGENAEAVSTLLSEAAVGVPDAETILGVPTGQRFEHTVAAYPGVAVAEVPDGRRVDGLAAHEHEVVVAEAVRTNQLHGDLRGAGISERAPPGRGRAV
jgi:hypothetical protein